MAENKGSNRTDEKNNTKDISEILKMLRDSVGKPIEEKPSEKLDDQIEEKLREKLNDAEADEQNEDPDEGDEPWYGDEEESEEDLEAEDTEDSDEDDAPWYGDEEESEEDLEVEDTEEADEGDEPWYGDEEESEEDLEVEDTEDSDEGDEPWYGDEGAEDEPLEAAEIEEIAEDEIPMFIGEENEDDAFDADEDGISDEDDIELTEDDIIAADPLDEDSKWFIDDEADEVSEEEFFEEKSVEEEAEEVIDDEIADDPDDEDLVIEEGTEEEIAEEDIPEEDIPEEDIPEEDVAKDEDTDEASDADNAEEPEHTSGFDETDIALLELMGYKVVDDNGDDELVHTEPSSGEKESGTYDHDGGEYVVKDQRDDILAGYKREKKKILIRLAITGGASLLLLLYEILFFSGVTMPWIFNQVENPVAHIMVSLQFAVVIVAASAIQIFDGFKALFTGRATPYSLSSAVITANVIYTLIIAFIHPENFMLFNFAGALAMLLAVTGEYLLACHEMKSFEVLSDPEVKGRFALENDDCSGEVLGAPVRSLRAYRTEFNRDYFARTRKAPFDLKGLWILIAAVAGAAMVTFGLTALIWNIGDALKAAVLVINFGMPLGAICTYSLPIMMASHIFIKRRGALIGHSAADEYSEVGFLTFDESDIFPSLKISHVEFKPTGDMPVAEILVKTGLMFSQIGGPISRTVRLDEREYRYGDVEITGIFDDGIMATVDGCDMLAGSARFLELYGVSVSASADARDLDPANGILYVSIDGRLAARYYLKYRPDRDFVRMVNILGDMGVAIGVRTHNPAINTDVIAARCPQMKYKVYAIKTGSGESDDITSEREETESGICGNGKAVSLSMPFIAAKRLKKIYRVDKITRLAAAAAGGAFVMIMSLFGFVHEFNSLQSAIYQLVWLLPTSALAVFGFCRRK